MKVFVDTSALLAILDEDDRNHAEAAEIFRTLLAGPAELVTHNYVAVESLALVRRRLGNTAADGLADGIFPALETVWVDKPLHELALAAHRASAAASLVDHVSFEVMRREGIVTAFAFDADFEVHGFQRAVAVGAGQGRRLSEERPPYLADQDAFSDLVSVAEIAARAGRSVNTVQSWRRRHRDFPAPVASLATGPVWRWTVVESWINDRAAPRRGRNTKNPADAGPSRGERVVETLRAHRGDLQMSTDELMAMTRGD